ncbi:hypothetical protein BD309DRAFT_972664 [Dichomitus squalens]|uniref:Uncharacterized protein n=1 Tax=Dichomitus squalens TaxID=114155 RepID=A0A4Q9PKM7_9APHY|nr:hypothetical protein BD309DRAFT_972664 [Dichomitus squalens]TBU54707.1 hypothetical protein BD310DRAFT_935342 [Dichomitus squalens]
MLTPFPSHSELPESIATPFRSSYLSECRKHLPLAPCNSRGARVAARLLASAKHPLRQPRRTCSYGRRRCQTQRHDFQAAPYGFPKARRSPSPFHFSATPAIGAPTEDIQSATFLFGAEFADRDQVKGQGSRARRRVGSALPWCRQGQGKSIRGRWP